MGTLEHLPRSLLTPLDGAVRLDLGCGRAKVPGFIGVDRFALPGVAVLADLNARLPFANDSVDLVYASHSLEHVRDLGRTIREIHRICKHGAQLCIVAPYYAQGLNLANPYHLHAFNEHTPRFWTASPLTLIEPAEYCHPHASAWGLLESDNSTPDIDIRCVRMEFFYFREYRELPKHEQRRRRKHEQDVCDQLVYHLLVLKRVVSDEEFLQMARDMELFESPYVTVRRLQERCERLESSAQETIAYTRQLEVGLQETTRRNDELEAAFREACGYRDSLEKAYHEVRQYKDQLESGYQELKGARERLERDYDTVVRAKNKLEADYAEAVRYKDHLERDLHLCGEDLVREGRRLQAEIAEIHQERDALERERATLSNSVRWLETVRADLERQLRAAAPGDGHGLGIAAFRSWAARCSRSLTGRRQVAGRR